MPLHFDPEWLREQYVTLDKTTPEIAALRGCSITAVNNALRRFGIPVRPSGTRLRHGSGSNPTYRSWHAMMTRCTNTNAKDYPRYGGKGIKVCARWYSVDAFIEDMGERPPGTTIDRIDSSKGYYFLNCRWATPYVQVRQHCKITPPQILAIAADPRIHRKIAADYGVSRATVSLIKQGKIHRPVLEAANREEVTPCP